VGASRSLWGGGGGGLLKWGGGIDHHHHTGTHFTLNHFVTFPLLCYRSIEVESGPDADTPRPVGVGLLLCMLERGGDQVAQALLELTGQLQVWMCMARIYVHVLGHPHIHVHGHVKQWLALVLWVQVRV